MLQTLVYNIAAAGVNAVNSDLLAAVDAEFSQRNNHYIFSEQYKLLAAYAGGVSVLNGRFQVPAWNAITEFAIDRVNRSLSPPANPMWNSYFHYPPDIPIEEEFQVQLTNNLGAATEIENVVLQLGSADWNNNIPRGRLPITMRCTAAPTMVLNQWSPLVALALPASVRGGVYAVIGAAAVVLGAVAFRIVFPRAKMYMGRKLRPGNICTNAAGNSDGNCPEAGRIIWGEWGRFHTFEMPQIEFFGTIAGAQTANVFLDLVYIGESANALAQGSF